MKISNNGKYWIVQDSFNNVTAIFKSLKALTDYILVTEQVTRMKRG